MTVTIGGIYEISKNWHPYDTPIFNHMPAIVIDIYSDKAEIVLIGALQKNSKRENHLMIDVEINSKKYISAVACDVVHQIPLNYIESNIGYVKKEIIDMIYNKRGHRYERDESTMLNNMESHEIHITDTEKFIAMMSNIEENTKKSREISEKTQAPFYVWKERLIGFVFGIIASVVANIIWEFRFTMWDAVIKFINFIVSSFTN